MNGVGKHHVHSSRDAKMGKAERTHKKRFERAFERTDGNSFIFKSLILDIGFSLCFS
jgi:hypothetical protein